MSTALEAAPAPRTSRGTGRRPSPLWLVLVATALPMFMATLDNLVMTNALPVLHEEFGASVEELQWFMNSYTLAFASTILMAVALGDRFGRRTVFLIGIVVFTLSSAFAALASDPGQLIAARALQGFGAAAIMPLSLTLLAGSVPLARRPLAIGIWGGVAGLGVATGPLIGGAVIEGWAWQAIFWINVPVGVVSVALALLALPNSFGARLRADLVGLVLSGLGLLALVYGIVRGNEAGWDSLEVLGSLIVGRRAARRVHRLGGARDGTPAAAAALPRSQLLGRERRGVRIHLRRVRLDLHPDPVHAGGAGRDAAGGCGADLAVDARPDGGGTARGSHRPPRGHARAHRVGPRAARRRAVLGRAAPRRLGRVPRLRRALHHRRHRHGARVRAVGDRGARHHGARRPRQGERHELDAARSGRSPSASPCRPRSSRVRAASSRRSTTPWAPSRRCTWVPQSSWRRRSSQRCCRRAAPRARRPATSPRATARRSLAH